MNIPSISMTNFLGTQVVEPAEVKQGFLQGTIEGQELLPSQAVFMLLLQQLSTPNNPIVQTDKPTKEVSNETSCLFGISIQGKTSNILQTPFVPVAAEKQNNTHQPKGTISGAGIITQQLNPTVEQATDQSAIIVPPAPVEGIPLSSINNVVEGVQEGGKPSIPMVLDSPKEEGKNLKIESQENIVIELPTEIGRSSQKNDGPKEEVNKGVSIIVQKPIVSVAPDSRILVKGIVSSESARNVSADVQSAGTKNIQKEQTVTADAKQKTIHESRSGIVPVQELLNLEARKQSPSGQSETFTQPEDLASFKVTARPTSEPPSESFQEQMNVQSSIQNDNLQIGQVVHELKRSAQSQNQPNTQNFSAASLQVTREQTGVINQKHSVATQPTQELASWAQLSGSMIDQVSTTMVIQIREKKSEMRVFLQPESLGDMLMKVRQEGGKLNAEIEVSSQTARVILEGNLPQLREALISRGIDIQRLEVVADHQATMNYASAHPEMKQNKGKRNTELELESAQPVEAAHNLGYNTMEVIL